MAGIGFELRKLFFVDNIKHRDKVSDLALSFFLIIYYVLFLQDRLCILTIINVIFLWIRK